MSRGDRTVPATVRAVNQYTGQKDRYLESCDSFIRCRLWNVRGLDRSAVKHLFEECNISLNPLRQFKTAYLTNSDYVVSTSSLTSNSHCVCPVVGRDGSVGIATPYGLYCPGIESRCGRDFQHPSRPALELTHPPIKWVPVISTVGKAAGAWRYHHPIWRRG